MSDSFDDWCRANGFKPPIRDRKELVTPSEKWGSLSEERVEIFSKTVDEEKIIKKKILESKKK